MKSLIIFIYIIGNALCGYNESNKWIKHSDYTTTEDNDYKSNVTRNTDRDSCESVDLMAYQSSDKNLTSKVSSNIFECQLSLSGTYNTKKISFTVIRLEMIFIIKSCVTKINFQILPNFYCLLCTRTTQQVRNF